MTRFDHAFQGCQKWCLHPYNEAQRIQHTQQCTERVARERSRVISAEQECSICLENVMSKADPSERRFGLMSCDHPFCLACVRGWRANIDSGADIDTVNLRIHPFHVKSSDIGHSS